jgi:predicted DNA-binding transcriptional regulator YafY
MILRELLIFHGPLFRFGQAARTREVIEQAMNAGTSVQIEYRDADGTYTLREIIPLSIEENVRATKVIAFCHLRKENRTFRLDRIARIL